MTEHEITEVIRNDKWMMEMLREAEALNLPDWMIGAGFVRNKIWDYLHGFSSEKVPTNDLDLIYMDKANPDPAKDEKLSQMLSDKTGVNWEVVNQVYTHAWHNTGPYADTEAALADWVETPTCVAISLNNGIIKLYAPLGIDDLVNLVVRRNDKCSDSDSYEHRVTSKKWAEKWPKLKIIV